MSKMMQVTRCLPPLNTPVVVSKASVVIQKYDERGMDLDLNSGDGMRR